MCDFAGAPTKLFLGGKAVDVEYKGTIDAQTMNAGDRPKWDEYGVYRLTNLTGSGYMYWSGHDWHNVVEPRHLRMLLREAHFGAFEMQKDDILIVERGHEGELVCDFDIIDIR